MQTTFYTETQELAMLQGIIADATDVWLREAAALAGEPGAEEERPSAFELLRAECRRAEAQARWREMTAVAA